MSGELSISFGQATNVGLVRDNNEDRVDQVAAAGRQLFILADGMGGMPGGEVASAVVGETARDSFLKDPQAEPIALLRAAVLTGHEACLEVQNQRPELSRMGTTLELLLVEGAQVWWAHVGDSRQYRLQPGQNGIVQLTIDQTVVQQLVDEGRVSREEARTHPLRNMLRSVVGSWEQPMIELCPDTLVFERGDCILMCSDGLTDMVADAEIGKALQGRSPQEACDHLVQLALDAGGHDNVTVQVVRWE